MSASPPNPLHVTLHVPTFHHAEFLKMDKNEKSKGEVHDFFSSNATNWETEGLLKEIESCHPTANDIVDAHHGTRDMEKFKAAYSKLFPVGRQFASRA